MDSSIYVIDSIDKYNSLYGFETLHPLVSVVDLNHAKCIPDKIRILYGVYAVFLKMVKGCEIRYGRQIYDYQEGTIVCFAPGQSVEVTMNSAEPQTNVLGLIFHPDLIKGTSLGRNIRKYGFFSYSANEALHVSEQEKALFMDSLRTIRTELEHSVDKHSRTLLSMHIELLLEYCLRFYDRQFITRKAVNRDVLTKFEEELDNYFFGNTAAANGLPSVKYFAERCFLSPNYFGDLIKKETGRTPQEYIQAKIINLAKEELLGTTKTVNEISYGLGFQYSQHFNRYFKRSTGMTPNEYRKVNA